MGERMTNAHLRLLAQDVRAFLEPQWRMWHLHAGQPELVTESQGTCGRSSLFLRDVLRNEGYAAEFAAVCPTEGNKGFRSPWGWKGHAWVESCGLILDVTADQFGARPVLVTGQDDPRYGRGRDTAAPQFIAVRQAAVKELMSLWATRNQIGRTG